MKLFTNRTAFILTTLFLLAAATAACQKAAETNTNANRSSDNTNTQPAANSSPAEAAKTSESPSASGSLATPTEAYRTAYAARKNKDIAGLKRVLSKEVQDFLTEMGKEEKKTLDDQLKELADRPQADKAESRNEKIDGDRATLEYLNERGTWSTMDFVKEGSDWKISLPKAEK
ncbi:MAG TPA: hypothetical protein VJS44_05180 [Pyrinomonadaceae bacterium]|nr:hypothetical protein [Pyrinomonadaceae bacterium]